MKQKAAKLLPTTLLKARNTVVVPVKGAYYERARVRRLLVVGFSYALFSWLLTAWCFRNRRSVTPAVQSRQHRQLRDFLTDYSENTDFACQLQLLEASPTAKKIYREIVRSLGKIMHLN